MYCNGLLREKKRKKKIYETAKLIKNLILRCHFSVKSRHRTLILEVMKTGFGINYY